MRQSSLSIAVILTALLACKLPASRGTGSSAASDASAPSEDESETVSIDALESWKMPDALKTRIVSAGYTVDECSGPEHEDGAEWTTCTGKKSGGDNLLLKYALYDKKSAAKRYAKGWKTTESESDEVCARDGSAFLCVEASRIESARKLGESILPDKSPIWNVNTDLCLARLRKEGWEVFSQNEPHEVDGMHVSSMLIRRRRESGSVALEIAVELDKSRLDEQRLSSHGSYYVHQHNGSFHVEVYDRDLARSILRGQKL